MQLFYSPDATDGLFTLDPEESRHAVRVLRLRQGDTINVTDGKGILYKCKIIEASEKACIVEAVETECSILNSQFSIHLAVAPTKNPSRMEWLVEKAVEVGVGEITLLNCDHSERTFLKTDRLEKLAVSAMKQSLHTILPAINPAVTLRDWLNSQINTLTHSHIQKFIAHCEAGKPRTPLHDALKPGMDAVVLIGPEGDFSEEEIALALECGFQPVSLGPSRLRTETAALYATVAFNIVQNESNGKSPIAEPKQCQRS